MNFTTNKKLELIQTSTWEITPDGKFHARHVPRLRLLCRPLSSFFHTVFEALMSDGLFNQRRRRRRVLFDLDLEKFCCRCMLLLLRVRDAFAKPCQKTDAR